MSNTWVRGEQNHKRACYRVGVSRHSPCNCIWKAAIQVSQVAAQNYPGRFGPGPTILDEATGRIDRISLKPRSDLRSDDVSPSN